MTQPGTRFWRGSEHPISTDSAKAKVPYVISVPGWEARLHDPEGSTRPPPCPQGLPGTLMTNVSIGKERKKDWCFSLFLPGQLADPEGTAGWGWQQNPGPASSKVQESQHTDFPEEERSRTGSLAARLQTQGDWAANTPEVCLEAQCWAMGIWQEQGEAT